MQEPAVPYTNIQAADHAACVLHVLVMNATSCLHCLGRMITITPVYFSVLKFKVSCCVSVAEQTRFGLCENRFS